MEVLTRRFKGIIVCDGWKPYGMFTNRIQRCWAHLLRESKEIAEKFEEAIPLHKMLKELYEILNEALENDPPPKVRKTYGNWREKRFGTGSGKSILSRKSGNSSGKSIMGSITGSHLSSIRVWSRPIIEQRERCDLMWF